MLINNLNVLITRPENEGRVLASKLEKLDVNSLCQPMFDYQGNDNQEILHKLLRQVQQPIVIFISVSAVTYANKLYALSSWPVRQFFAVGTATAQALKALNIKATSPEIQTSEGLLTFAELQNITDQDIIIVRGDGGREHLADSLKARNANVTYFEAYQRIWRQLPSNIEQHWRNHHINCMVITSDAILQNIVQLINRSDGYWRTACYWVVASERIAMNAKALGFKRVINANGANDNAISKAIISDVTNNME
ncbi:uroporphyrinogen-III synthase [Pseudocolwellia agarivorans]|uniref:uroporphyrinogen-III synthase n=1 Tax=Pseudocolwellia agarivorans TaxID=1911682 RepID=UPI0009845E1E|nr:uroporphyrinogen-III synthase [Pseudocolwellia agarivorans]